MNTKTQKIVKINDFALNLEEINCSELNGNMIKSNSNTRIYSDISLLISNVNKNTAKIGDNKAKLYRSISNKALELRISKRNQLRMEKNQEIPIISNIFAVIIGYKFGFRKTDLLELSILKEEMNTLYQKEKMFFRNDSIPKTEKETRMLKRKLREFEEILSNLEAVRSEVESNDPFNEEISEEESISSPEIAESEPIQKIAVIEEVKPIVVKEVINHGLNKIETSKLYSYYKKRVNQLPNTKKVLIKFAEFSKNHVLEILVNNIYEIESPYWKSSSQLMRISFEATIDMLIAKLIKTIKKEDVIGDPKLKRAYKFWYRKITGIKLSF